MITLTPLIFYSLIGMTVAALIGAVFVSAPTIITIEHLRRNNHVLMEFRMKNETKIRRIDDLEREFRKVYHAAGFNLYHKTAEARLEDIRIAAEAAFRAYDDADREAA